MKKLARDILSILTRIENKKLLQQTLFDISIALLDIGFLATLLLLIRFYIEPDAGAFWLVPAAFLKSHPLMVFGFFCLFYAIKNQLAYKVLSHGNQFLYSVASRLSEEKLDTYLCSGFDNYVTVDSAVHIRRIAHQPVEFSNYILRGLQQIFSQSVLVLVTLIAILVYKPFLFLMMVGMLCIPILIIAVLLKKRLNHIRQEAREAGEHSLQYLKEALAGYVESKIFFRKDFFVQRYMNYQKKLNGFLAGQQVIQGMPARLMETFAIIGLFLVFLFSHTGTTQSFITIATFMAASYKLIPGIAGVLNAMGQVKAYEPVLNILKDAADEKSSKPQEKGTSIRSICFSDVGFSYKRKQVFNQLNFEIQAGDFVRVAGDSGSGKTTMINLLLGFLPLQEGSILMNGEPLENYAPGHFLNKISYVKQQPFFIHDSAFQNIVLGVQEPDHERLNEAEHVTGFGTFLNGSMHKMIRENGKNISGGQRQRIALARALYKDFDLLILDEPFSELDKDSERKLLQRLRELAEKGKIILLITHHPVDVSFFTKTIQLD